MGKLTAVNSTTDTRVPALEDRIPPVLDVDVFGPGRLLLLSRLRRSHGDRLAVEPLLERDAGELEDRRHDVGVRRRERDLLALGHARPPHDERYVHVLLDRTRLARRQPVLAHVVPVVRRVDYVRVLEDLRAGFLEPSHDRVYELVDC